MPQTNSATPAAAPESAFDALRREYFAEHEPDTPTECLLVEQMAYAAMRMREIHSGPSPDAETDRRYERHQANFHRALRVLTSLRKAEAPKPESPRTDRPLPSNVICITSGKTPKVPRRRDESHPFVDGAPGIRGVEDDPAQPARLAG
jgi:hypothetical protein